MARVRYIGPEPVTVPELGERLIQPDEVVEVPDARFEGYVCQTTNWKAIEEPGSHRGEHGPETVSFSPAQDAVAAPKKSTTKREG
ncbi:hypothetical protein EAO70_09345 [Streptomyces sp. adm13(2018)]|uniref:hypothetical protein n=1 Tax=Streptomyces sp. adm13(2018) TaxID=2479007 RepID=UPI0011CD4FC1|nr:hypothetical protein [Streptomyces sp. adm13(2018)]TXS20207.1 hypothetical protein EAO70_09345 [Streptomyces sp. adm13(2018)]